MDAESDDGGAVLDSSAGPVRETLFEQLLDAAPDATVGVDRTGRIVFANAQTLRLFGYAREELLGRPIEVLVPDDVVAAHRGCGTSILPRLPTGAMGAGKPLYARRKDGSVFPPSASPA